MANSYITPPPHSKQVRTGHRNIVNVEVHFQLFGHGMKNIFCLFLYLIFFLYKYSMLEFILHHAAKVSIAKVS